MINKELEKLVNTELNRLRKKYTKFSSLHEFWGLFAEESAELFEQIRKKPHNRSHRKITEETIQLIALLKQMLEDFT